MLVFVWGLWCAFSVLRTAVTGRPCEESQETDVHWRSSDGTGSFNYRMVFDVTLPQPGSSPCRLSIKAWDRDPLTFSSELIGAR